MQCCNAKSVAHTGVCTGIQKRHDHILQGRITGQMQCRITVLVLNPDIDIANKDGQSRRPVFVSAGAHQGCIAPRIQISRHPKPVLIVYRSNLTRYASENSANAFEFLGPVPTAQLVQSHPCTLVGRMNKPPFPDIDPNMRRWRTGGVEKHQVPRLHLLAGHGAQGCSHAGRITRHIQASSNPVDMSNQP